MEKYLEQVKLLTPEELRSRLAEFDEVVGPILPTTQALFQKRLARKLAAAEAASNLSASGDDKPPVSVTVSESQPADRTLSDVSKEGEHAKAKLDENASQYFGVCIPADANEVAAEDTELVFTDKTEALKSVKKHSGARFKVFKTKQEAEEFSRLTSSIVSPWKPSMKTSLDIVQNSQVSVESCPYKAPKPQELTVLRKNIEQGDYQAVETLVWDNPRYLISSGDTPVILQEGFRYNALHVAAIANQPVICQLIMDTIEDPNFIDKLYSHTNETQHTRTNRINFILDLYLNMPDKGHCESPLHFACKYGFADMVSILVAHPKVDRYLKNKYGETAADIICSRCRSADNETEKSRIQELLLGQYYVPLVRSEDNTTQPLIGQPWSPDSTHPMSMSLSSWNPKDPLMAVKACAGPMTPSKAEKFHKQWMTPPSGSPEHVRRKFVMTKREDSDKGLERIGRDLATKMQIPWVEYWDFLQTYTDLSSDDGFELLEEYFQKQRIALCLAEGMEKLDIMMTRSFHAGKEMGLSNFSWNLLSLTEELEHELHDSDSEREVSHLEGIQEDQDTAKLLAHSPQQNGSACKVENGNVPHTRTPPMMRTSMHRSNLYSTPVGLDTYGYGRFLMNRSMDRSDIMNQSVESISNSASPISCLSAIFAKLSLLDRSRSPRGPSRFLSCTSCMGNKSSYMGSPADYPMDSSYASSIGSRPYPKVPYFKEAMDTYNAYVASQEQPITDKTDKSNDFSKPPYNFLEKQLKQEKDLSNKLTEKTESEPSDISDKQVSSSPDVTKGNLTANSDSFHSAVSEASKKLDTASQLDESIDQLRDLSIGDKQADDTDNTWQTAASHLDLVLEMDRDKISGAMFESLFETLNERKNIENVSRYTRGSKTSPSPVRQDIVLDLKDENVFTSDNVLANVAVIPLHCSVTEIRLFLDIPFKVVRGNDSMSESMEEAALPSLVDVKFNFVRDTVIQALAIGDALKSKLYFIHGYMPTKSDLDAFRAMDSCVVDKNKYPLVSEWKAQISAYTADTAFSWQSPAKVRKQSNLSSSFPLGSSPASKNESVIYDRTGGGGSPRRSMSSTWSMPNIRTQLFSPAANRMSYHF